MPLQPGDTLLNGKYRIERLLGGGGFGFVYLAHDSLLREKAAVKELIPALAGNEDALKRFLGEAEATIRLTHRHIVRPHDVFADRGSYYPAMEYMHRGSLEEHLHAKGRLRVDEAVPSAVDRCEALASATVPVPIELPNASASPYRRWRLQLTMIASVASLSSKAMFEPDGG